MAEDLKDLFFGCLYRLISMAWSGDIKSLIVISTSNEKEMLFSLETSLPFFLSFLISL